MLTVGNIIVRPWYIGRINFFEISYRYFFRRVTRFSSVRWLAASSRWIPLVRLYCWIAGHFGALLERNCAKRSQLCSYLLISLEICKSRAGRMTGIVRYIGQFEVWPSPYIVFIRIHLFECRLNELNIFWSWNVKLTFANECCFDQSSSEHKYWPVRKHWFVYHFRWSITLQTWNY